LQQRDIFFGDSVLFDKRDGLPFSLKRGPNFLPAYLDETSDLGGQTKFIVDAEPGEVTHCLSIPIKLIFYHLILLRRQLSKRG